MPRRKRNPDERIQKLKRQALSSKSDDDVWAYIVAAKRAGLVNSPERPKYEVMTHYGKLEIQPFGNYKVVLSGKNLDFENFDFRDTYSYEEAKISFSQIWSWITDQGVLPRDELIQGDPDEWSDLLWRRLPTQPGWAPYAMTGKYDRYGNEVYRPNFVFTLSGSSGNELTLSADSLAAPAGDLYHLNFIIKQWMEKHQKEIDLAIVLGHWENVADEFKEYDKLNTQTENFRDRIISSTREWLEMEKQVNSYHRRNPSDDRLRGLQRRKDDPVRELLEKERTGLVSTHAVKMAAMLQHPIASQIYPELTQRYKINLDAQLHLPYKHFEEVFSEMLAYPESRMPFYRAIWKQIRYFYKDYKRLIKNHQNEIRLSDMLQEECFPVMDDIDHMLRNSQTSYGAFRIYLNKEEIFRKHLPKENRLGHLLYDLDNFVDVAGELEDEEEFPALRNIWRIHDLFLNFAAVIDDSDYVEAGGLRI